MPKFVEVPIEDWLTTIADAKRLRELLRIEYMRHDHLELPWNCAESDCPRFGKSLYLTGCNCVHEFKAKHVAAVKKELGL